MPKTMNRLLEGYHRFRSEYFEGDNRIYRTLKRGQNPSALVIACCDSRVDPSILLNCEPGDLFVIRNVANLVPPCEHDLSYHGTSAALEFGVCGLNIGHVILLGHSQCGGIQTLFEPPQSSEPNAFVKKWMELAEPAYQTVNTQHAHLPKDVQKELCAQQALIHSREHLHTFPWIAERIKNLELTVHTWYFEIETGFIHAYDAHDECFKKLE